MSDDSKNLVYVDEGCVDREEHIIATFEIETTPGTTLEQVGFTIAFDPTIGTWTRTEGETDDVVERYSGKVMLPLPAENQQSGIVRIAIPIADINPRQGGLPHLLAILGAPYTLKSIRSIRLINLELPRKFLQQWSGPRYGIDEIASWPGFSPGRPIISMMLKPRVGLSSDEYARMALEAYRGGVDVVMDDELLVSPEPSPLLQRVEKLVASARQAQQETGHPKYYATNITSSLRYITDLALKLQELGANFLYLNPFTIGFSVLEMLTAMPELRLPILCCRSGYGMWARGKEGILFFVLLKLARWMGADGIHMGSIGGSLSHAIIGDDSELRSRARWLTMRFPNVRRSYPILSGGLHPGNVEQNILRLGKDIIIQSGSGIQAHPQGPRAGAMAMRLAVDAACSRTPMLDVASSNPVLRDAIETFGYLTDKGMIKWSELSGEQEETGHQSITINTHGGAVVMGDLKMSGGKFVGRDDHNEMDKGMIEEEHEPE